jgi:hypothetical protein
MATQKIRSLLASDELRALSGKARRLAELQQMYIETAPPPLAQASRVGNWRAGTLFLLADNASVAAKLRQLAPRLLVKIRKREPEITVIRVEVQVGRWLKPTETAPLKLALPPETIENFRRLSERIPHSPLRTALAALVRRQGGGDNQPQTTSTKRSRT